MEVYCYVSEYLNDEGKTCARLKDKKTDKKVVMVTKKNDVSWKLIKLMQYASMIAPELKDRFGSEAIKVVGDLVSDNKEIIEINIDVDGGGYWWD